MTSSQRAGTRTTNQVVRVLHGGATTPAPETPPAGNHDAMELMLPGMPDAPERPAGDDRSKRRSWTAQSRVLITEGWHPLAGTRVRPDLGRCGTCAHRILQGGTAKPYPKCAKGPITRGEKTDVRSWWPACDRYDPKEPTR